MFKSDKLYKEVSDIGRTLYGATYGLRGDDARSSKNPASYSLVGVVNYLERENSRLKTRISKLEEYLGVEYKESPDEAKEYPKYVRKSK